MIVCGWCAAITGPMTCQACGRDPVVPWVQRGQEPRSEAQAKRLDISRRLTEARRALGPGATVDAIAELVGVSSRTVRRWHEMSAK